MKDPAASSSLDSGAGSVGGVGEGSSPRLLTIDYIKVKVLTIDFCQRLNA